jgi:hypothetical protein
MIFSSYPSAHSSYHRNGGSLDACFKCSFTNFHLIIATMAGFASVPQYAALLSFAWVVVVSYVYIKFNRWY